MVKQTLRKSIAAAMAVTLVGVISIAGCSKPAAKPAPAAPPAAESAARTDVYTTRGEVLAVEPDGSAKVRHEAMPTFKDADGNVIGMKPMAMIFRPSPGASFAGYKPGDKIEMKMTVKMPDYDTTAAPVKKLPADTALDYSRPAPATMPAMPGM